MTQRNDGKTSDITQKEHNKNKIANTILHFQFMQLIVLYNTFHFVYHCTSISSPFYTFVC